MRTIWVAWKGPITTLIGITAFMLALFGGKAFFADRTAQITPVPLEPAQHLNTRTWRTIASDPTSHAGARVKLWGRVTQVNPVGGAPTFHADVDAARHEPQNGTVNYPTDVIMHCDPDMLRKVAEGYIFTAEATVDGAETPGASPRGAAAVPTLTVTKLTITDKTVG